MTIPVKKTPLDYPSICLHECRSISEFEGHLDCWSPECQHPDHAKEAVAQASQAAWTDTEHDPDHPDKTPPEKPFD